jgi:signal transduction histidine kinase/ActR/RegA family two-component response regulator
MDGREYRVLLLPATRRDADVSKGVIERAGIACTMCRDVTDLARAAQEAVGAILATDACFQDPNIGLLLTQLTNQPPWSDVPVVLLCRTGHLAPIAEQVTSALRNVTVLERPTSTRTLLSSLKAALRARARQYQMREQFDNLHASESALKLASDALKDSNRRKDEFLAMLAHELRNPLAPIRNAIEILARMASDPLQGQAASIVKRQLNQLTRLVDDLLDMSRVTQGRIELRRLPLDLSAIVADARETVEPLLQERRHKLSVTCAADPLYVNGDHARLVQSVANILTNAAKYTDPGGEIRLSLRKQDRDAVIEITDNGMGISSDLLPHLFDLFVQGDRSLDRSQGGLGIGLSVVKRLIEMHGGEVFAHSHGPGHGSTFEIRLPLIQVSADARPAPEMHRCAPKRILIVDDNEDAADTLGAILELDGHRIDVVYTAKDALRRAEATSPEVILLDLGLPDMSGYEVAARLRGKLLSTQFVALTGYGQAEDVRRATSAGFDAHVIKPVDFEGLSTILASFKRDAIGQQS